MMTLGVRCIMACSDNYEGDIVVCGIVTKTKLVENAGRAFFDNYERIRNGAERDTSKNSDNDEDDEANETTNNNEEDAKWGAKHRNDKKAKGSGAPTKLKKLIDGPNLYRVLGVDDTCTMDVIRKTYRRLALEFHPDKKSHKERLAISDSSPSLISQQSNGSEGSGSSPSSSSLSPSSTYRKQLPRELRLLTDDEIFLIIQDAYETLSDSRLRHQYDSALPFDESIPNANDIDDNDAQSFYSVFEEVFNRNARWSGKKPVPKLGGPLSNIRDVYRFYSFWGDFVTTRDFSVNDEYDTLDSECRDERRWMERQNIKIRKKYIKEEKERLNKLTDLAFSLDPRVRAEKEEQKKRKEEARDAKRKEAEAKIEAQRAEEKRRKDEEEAKKQAEIEKQRQETEARQKAKAEVKKNRQRIRAVCNDLVNNGTLKADDLQELCLGTPVEELDAIASDFERLVQEHDGLGKVVIKFTEIRQAIFQAKEIEEENHRKQQQKNKQQENPQPVSKPPESFEQWSADELSALAKGLQKYPGGTNRRWFYISQMIGTRTEKEVIQKTKEMAEGNTLKSMGSKLSQGAFDQYLKDNTNALKKIDVSADERDIVDTVQKIAPITTSTPALSTNQHLLPAETLQQISNVWTSDQQKLFEQALKSHPISLSPKERWIAIAKDVPGKTPKQCLARFKEIRSAILNNR